MVYMRDHFYLLRVERCDRESAGLLKLPGTSLLCSLSLLSLSSLSLSLSLLQLFQVLRDAACESQNPIIDNKSADYLTDHPRIWIVCLFGFLTSALATRLSHGQLQRMTPDNFTQKQSGKTMTSFSAGHIILTPIQPAGSGLLERGSKLRPPDQFFVCLVGFLTFSSTTRLYRGRAPRQSV